MGWQKTTSFSCVVALAISGAALQLDGNQTDSFTLKGGLDKATTCANWQQGRCEILKIQDNHQTVFSTIKISRTNHIHMYRFPTPPTKPHRQFSEYNRLFSHFLCCYLTLQFDVILLQVQQHKQCPLYNSYSNMSYVMVFTFVLVTVWHTNWTRLKAR